MSGYIVPKKGGRKYKIHQYSEPFNFNGNSYWLNIQFCWALVRRYTLKLNYKVDFRELTGFTQPSPFGRNWKGWYFELFGLTVMMKNEIK